MLLSPLHFAANLQQPCRRSLQLNWRRPAKRLAAVHRASSQGSEVEQQVCRIPPVLLPPVSSAAQLEEEGRWVARMVRCWLNEEWMQLEVHNALSETAGQAYVKLRRQGLENMSELVLGLASELLAFDFWDTFTDAFEVSNKVVELLMVRQGCEVCCASAADLSAIERYEGLLRTEQAAQ